MTNQDGIKTLYDGDDYKCFVNIAARTCVLMQKASLPAKFDTSIFTSYNDGLIDLLVQAFIVGIDGQGMHHLYVHDALDDAFPAVYHVSAVKISVPDKFITIS